MKSSCIALLVVGFLAACGGSTKPKKTTNAGPPKAVEEVPARADHVEPADRASLAQPPYDADKTPTGLMSKVLHPGSGSLHPTKNSTVKVHYTGWTRDGNVFDSSRNRGEPAEFPLDHVIPGWTEGVQLMVVGEERRFWIPADLAYGEHARRGSPSGQLTFDIELLSIVSMPVIPETPPDVASVPADAVKTKSGLAYKVVTPGTGKKPTLDDTIRIEWTGWSTDGHMFDSTFLHPSTQIVFPLAHGVRAWIEGIQLMQEGETARFWAPAKLAFGESPPQGIPKGMLVFEIHLIGIEKE